MLKNFFLILGLLVSAGAMAEDTACNVAAAEKKLAGAAKQSFLQKCEVDARAICESASKDLKLAGSSKTSFEKKCLKDAMGD